MYALGDRVQVIDRIDPDIVETGTIKYIEKDIDQLVWVYIVSDNEMLNDKVDPKFNWRYWQILAYDDPYLSLA